MAKNGGVKLGDSTKIEIGIDLIYVKCYISEWKDVITLVILHIFPVDFLARAKRWAGVGSVPASIGRVDKNVKRFIREDSG